MHLVSNRLKLSLFNQSDKNLFIEITTDPQMMEYVYDPYTEKEANNIFNEKMKPWTINCDTWLTFGITELESNEKIGHIGLKIINHTSKIAEVGYMLKQSSHGKGFASESLQLIKDHAFAELGLNKLVATCSVDNVGSYKLLEKIGFKQEGRLNQNTFIKNQYIDDFVYGLCKRDL